MLFARFLLTPRQRCCQAIILNLFLRWVRSMEKSVNVHVRACSVIHGTVSEILIPLEK